MTMLYLTPRLTAHRNKRSGVMCTHNARIYSSVSNKATVSLKARLRLFYKFVPPSINALPRILALRLGRIKKVGYNLL